MPTAPRFVLTGTQAFDGERLLDGPYDVTVDGAVIAAVEPSGRAAAGVQTADGSGATLLPGLIDAHVHLRGTDDLARLERWGVTTALDMGTWPPSLVEELRHAGSTDVRSTGAGAIGPNSLLAGLPGRPADSIVTDPAAGRRFVATRISEGMDYIKVIVDPPAAADRTRRRWTPSSRPPTPRGRRSWRTPRTRVPW